MKNFTKIIGFLCVFYLISSTITALGNNFVQHYLSPSIQLKTTNLHSIFEKIYNKQKFHFTIENITFRY